MEKEVVYSEGVHLQLSEVSLLVHTYDLNKSTCCTVIVLSTSFELHDAAKQYVKQVLNIFYGP